MLTIKASAQPSTIHGIGLIADERIPKGTMTWKFDPIFDLVFDPEDVEKMSPMQQELMSRYAYLSQESGQYVFSMDDSRFTNHSETENNIDVRLVPGEIGSVAFANRDIEKGEELLVNYRAFDVHDKESDEEYLKK